MFLALALCSVALWSQARRPEPPPAPASELAGPSRNTKIESFHTAKKYAFAVHSNRPLTLYCGCRYSEDLRVDHASCGYRPKGTSARASRVEWEHVVPAHAFGQSFVEWREGHSACVNSKGQPFKGRNCARKANPLFRLMEADLYNLFPAIGEVNGLRSNYSMAELPGEPREFGSCDVEIHSRRIEPRPQVRGDIARVYFYMDQAYPGRGVISRKNRELFAAWDRLDPVDDWECQRAALIAELQGNVNPVLAGACAERNVGSLGAGGGAQTSQR